MAQTFEIEIAVPAKLVVKRHAESAQIPGKDGYMGILPGHAALLSELGDGTITINGAGSTETFHVIGGYVEIRDDHVRVAADRVE